MDFVTGLPILMDEKTNSSDSIFVIVNCLTKMVHYKLVKITINVPGLTEVIIDVVVRHHDLSDSIIIDRGLFFTSKFWLLLCYFLGIKRRLSTAFYWQTDGQTERQNNTIKTYLRAFVNFEQDNWARLLPMAEFAYNNTKNASIGHTPFELNCGYHPCISYEEDLDPRSNWEWRKNYPPSSKSWWPCANRTSTTPKNFKSKSTIKISSPKTTPPAKKSDWVASTSKPSGIVSWKPNFLVFFEYYTQ